MELGQHEVRTRTMTVEADGVDLPVRLVWTGPAHGRVIVVLHEKRGLDAHTLDLARRLAGEGYTVLLPDLLARAGGSGVAGGLSSGARGLPKEWLVDDALAVIDAMLDLLAAARFGVIGYSIGGVRAWSVAGRDPRCQALIDFHGRAPADVDLDLTGVAALAVYTSLDDQDKIQAATDLLGTARYSRLEVFKAQHRGFEDPSRIEAFDPDAAERAWQLTLGWLDEYLSCDRTIEPPS